MQRMITMALLLWAAMAGLPMSGQVLNDQISFQVNGIEWKSTYDGDGGLVGLNGIFIDDLDKEENTVQIWLRANNVDLTPKVCVTWDADNYSNYHRSETESNYSNLAIGVVQNTDYDGFNAVIDYWEDDAGGRCTYTEENLIAIPPVPFGDDGYVTNRVLKDYYWLYDTRLMTTNDYWYGVKDKPQGEWHGHPDKATSLYFNYEHKGGVEIELITIWNYAHGNTIADPLNFGTIPANSMREHVNKNADIPGTTLSYTDTYGNSTRDVFYRFVLAEDVNNVNINTNFYSYPPNGSTTEIDTRLILLDEQHNVIADVDNLTGVFPNQARMSFGNLCAGTYYVVVEGGSNSPDPKEGRFKLQISTGNGTPLAPVNTNQWTVFAYDEVNMDNPGKLRGTFTVNDLHVNTDDFYAADGNYGNIANFAPHACSPFKHLTGSDYFTHVYRRKFACGKYAIRLDHLDDYVKIFVDGTLVYENYNYGSNQGIIWTGEVNDEITVYHAELSGGEKIDFEVIPSYASDWSAYFYSPSGQFFGSHPMNYGATATRLREPYGYGTNAYYSILQSYDFDQSCGSAATNGVSIDNYYMEFTKYSFTPGVYAIKAEEGYDKCSNCNFRLIVNQQLIYQNGSYTSPVFVYLDEYSKVSLFNNLGGVPYFSYYHYGSQPFFTHRGISANPQANISAFFDITQDKTTIYPCEAATFSVQKNNGLSHIAGRIQWQQSTDGGNNWSDIPDAHAEQYTLNNINTIGTTYHIRYLLKDRKDLVTFTSSALQVTVQADPSFVGGTALGTEALQPCTAPSIITVSGASADVIAHQWEHSTDGINYTPISGATGIDYTPPSLQQDTYYRRISSNACGVTVASTAITKTVVTDNDSYGNNEWNIELVGTSSYNIATPLTYIGKATQSDMNLNIASSAGGPSSPPSSIPNYQGCTADPQTYQIKYRRTNWPCDNYLFTLADIGFLHQFYLNIDIDGDGNWEATHYFSPAPFASTLPSPYSYLLNQNSKVEVIYVKPISFMAGGDNEFILNVTPLASSFNAGTATGDETLFSCTVPSAITVTGTTASTALTYQWQASTDGGNNWSNIAGATSADYSPAALAQTTAFRRMTVDLCSNVAYTNAVVKTVNALPAEGVTGNGIWNAYAYTGQNFDTYTGHFTLPNASFNLTNEAMNADVNGNPAVAASYVGCPLPNDYWSVKLLRTGWSCGTYRFDFTDWDDHMTLRIDRDGDGHFEYSQSLTCCATNVSHSWNVDLNPSSVVTIEFQEVAGQAFLNLNVTQLSNGLVAGTAAGNETANRCAPLSAITVTGEAASSTVTYQWQASTDGGNNWSDLSGATAAMYTPSALTVTTAFRRKATDACNNTTFTNAVTKTINPLPAEGGAGNGVWNAYAYTGQNFDTYTGHFTLPNAGFNLTNEAMNADVNGNPSVAASYVGCPLPNDYWSVKLLRTGWSCGTYRFEFTDWDDHMTLRVDRDGDGNFEYSQSLACCATGASHSWNIDLNPNSVVAIEFQEVAGLAFLNLNVTQLSNGLTAGTASGDETANRCAQLSPITVTGEAASSPVTYQWQASTDGGNNWTDLTGATAATYTPSALTVTTAFRRKATDVCSNATFTNAVTKTINPLPAEGLAGLTAWHGYAYNGMDFSNYQGFYTLSDTGLNLAQAMNNDVFASPSAIAGYIGCTIPNDFFSTRLVRQGFDCGYYDFHLTDADDEIFVYVDTDGDGNIDHSFTKFWAPTPPDEHHYYYLNPNSRVTVTVMEGGGGANIALGITRLSSGLAAGTAAGDETIFACAAPSTITVTGETASSPVTYQWQASTDGGNNWSDLTEATAATYTPSALAVTTAFRRKATDACGNVAFTNAVTKTINPLPAEGLAGSATWYGYAYEGDWGAYRGRFSASSTDLQLSSIGLSANVATAQPADIGTYVGCATDPEAFSVRLLRRHWTPAHYTFALADIDGNAQIAIDTDGDGAWEYLSANLDAPASNLWAGVLDSNAVVRIEYRDDAGVSRLHVTASSAALPVELLHFEASIDDDRKTRLHWATASELQNEGFEIERSTDGLTWEVIGWMPGQGTTQERTDYFHWDEAPHDGVNYYRLHQRDYDGTGAYSPIRSVQYDHSPKGQMPIAFPNPVTSGTLTLLHAQGRVTLSSALGQPLQHWRIDTDEARIDLSTFPKGAYWLSVVRSDGQVTTLRILK